MFRIRKSGRRTIVSSCPWKWWRYILFFWIIIILWSFYFFIIKNYTISEIIGWLLLWLIISIVWFFCYRIDRKTVNAKDLKKTWLWILKKVKITSIEHYHSVWDDWFDWDYLQANEWTNIYCSDGFNWGTIKWTSIDMLKDIYRDYWFAYNEKHKIDVLKWIDKHIEECRIQMQYSWFFKRLWSKVILNSYKHAKEIVENWYIPPTLEINWHKISVWDTVDVYIDPKNERNYWMDIDFLFDK